MMAVKKKTSKKKSKKKIAKKKTGRPLLDVNWDTVNKLCLIQCTGEEIASFINISYDTLERACKREQKVRFADYILQKKEGGKASLRRKQWKLVEDGNPTMCIWLGKQYLGQTDKPNEKSSDDITAVLSKLIDKLPN
jgi:hypothetical protein